MLIPSTYCFSRNQKVNAVRKAMMQVAVRPASVSRGACTLAAVTVAAEKACAASCKALEKAGV